MEYPQVPICLNTSENNLDKDLYGPCLEWATSYDRGVGYFTSGWINKNAYGFAAFANKGGKVRWITSPILEEKDYEVIKSGANNEDIIKYFQELLNESIENLANEIESKTLNALAWMLEDGILEFKFAIPTRKLSNGDFHDKFGIFMNEEGDKLSFTGSINDSSKGFSNYESIKVFKSWEGMGQYINPDVERFNKIWNGHDENLNIFEPNEIIRRRLIQLRKGERPYKNKRIQEIPSYLWDHQKEAFCTFLKRKNGILEMATGTGKTLTTLAIIKELFFTEKIDRVIITMNGNDLLDQWYHGLLNQLDGINIYRYYESSYKELPQFVLARGKAILLISRQSNRLLECLDILESRNGALLDRMLFVFDEVHGLGSNSIRTQLMGRFSKYTYRLGLSATPIREFDKEGNQFILDEVGPVIFSFTLEDAIRKGILCELQYYPLDYELSQAEKQKKRDIIARYAAKRKNGEKFSDEEMYRDLARINKTSENKLPEFREIIKKSPDLLNRCIIFVETKEYGIEVQKVFFDEIKLPSYHTYYGEDDKIHLIKFGQGEINCLITCKKISEGVDIKSVENIFLFSSDRGKLVTTQRIGRSLRIDPSNRMKRANIVDFICLSDKDENKYNIGDFERKEWLQELAQIRRTEDENV